MSLKSRLTAFLGLALAGPAAAGVFTLSGPLTDDASTGISPANTYTHAVSGSTAAAVNGVNFTVLSSTATPPGITWVSAGNKADIVNNANTWVPATGGVTGTGLLSLLNSFTYAPQGPDPGSFQTFAMSGLVTGTTYDARLYIRAWDPTGASPRAIDLTMTNGLESDTFSIQEDRPGIMLGTGNNNQAYYLNYRFTAQTGGLTINAAVPAAAAAGSGSFHLFGLTNQAVPEPGSALCAALAAGMLAIRRRRC